MGKGTQWALCAIEKDVFKSPETRDGGQPRARGVDLGFRTGALVGVLSEGQLEQLGGK